MPNANIAELTEAGAPGHCLSAREREILTWVALGKSNTDIGAILQISPHTVGTYLKRILGKLDVSSRTTAAVRAAQMGLLPIV